MAENSTLIPFDALEGSSEFQSLPVADKLAAIDGWADATLEGTGYADPDSISQFARQAKDDYKRDAFAKAIDSRIDKSLSAEAKAAEAERLANEAFEDAQREGFLSGRDVPTGSIRAQGLAGARVGGGFKPRDPELSGLVKDYFLTNSERDGTEEQELDIGEGVKIAARQLPHPGKDIFKFRLPDGREVVQEGPSMQDAVKKAVEGNLDAFPDTGGDILARLGRGALDQGLLRMGEGVAGAAAMTGARAFFAPDVLASGSIGRATGTYQETMAPVVERDAELQRAAIEQTRADTVRDIINRIAPINPREAAESAVGQNNETLRQLPYALGQAGANIAVGAATGAAAPAVLGVGNIAAMGDQAAQEAVAAGRPEKAASAFLDAGVPGGLVETATDLFFTKAFSKAFGNALDVARKGTTGALLAAAKTGLKNATMGGVQEGAAEALQGVIANDVARRYYDENRDLFEGVGEQAAIGALTGVILGGLSGGIEGAQAQRASVAGKVAETTSQAVENVVAATESAPEVQIQRDKAEELRDNGLPNLAQALEDRAAANVDAAIGENVAAVGEAATAIATRLDEIESQLATSATEGPEREALLREYEQLSADIGATETAPTNETGIELQTQLGEQAAKEAANQAAVPSEVETAPEQAPDVPGVADQPEVTDQFPANEAQISNNETLPGVTEPTVEGAPQAPDGVASPVPGPTFERAVVQSVPLTEQTTLNVERQTDGSFRVARINTATGREIPMPRDTPASFASPAEALDYVTKLATPVPQPEAVVQEAAKPVPLRNDDLLDLVITEGIPARYGNIRDISKVTRRTGKGFRGIDRDVSRLGEFTNAPRIGEFSGEAKEVLQSMYRKDGGGSDPDVLAQMAFEAGLISEATSESLFEGIKERLRGDATRVGTAFNNQEAEAAAQDFATRQQADADAFFGNLDSIERSGGAVEASSLRVGDELQLGDDTLRVSEINEDGVTVQSRRYGQYTLQADTQVGYDRWLSEEGIEVSEEESASSLNRAEAEVLTKQLRERLGDSKVEAVTSEEHNILMGDRATLAAMRRLAQAFGYRVVGVKNAWFNGVVYRGPDDESWDGNIYINVNSSRPELNIVAHEMLHRMRQDAPALYRRLRRKLNADLKRYLSEVRPGLQGKSEALVEEEFMADYLGEMALNPKFWDSLSRREPSLFRELADYILNFLQGVIDKVKGDRIKVEHLLEDAASFRDAVETALVDFRLRQDAIARGVMDPEPEVFEGDESMPFADESPRLTESEYARHEELEAKHNAGTITEEETKDAQGLVDRAAKALGGIGPVFHGTGRWGKNDEFTVFQSRQPVTVYRVDGDEVRRLDSDGESISFYDDEGLSDGYHYGALSDALTLGSDEALRVRDREERPDSPHLRDLRRLAGKKVTAATEDRPTGDGFYFSGNENYGIVRRSARKVRAFLFLRNPLQVDEGNVEFVGSKWRKNQLIAEGYDGAVFSDTYRPLEQVVAFYPNQIKSADPFTGVPLRERFNPESDDIRFADGDAKRQQEWGEPEAGREDTVQSVEVARQMVREQIFDDTQDVTRQSIEEAARVLADFKAGNLDAAKMTGRAAANQALIWGLKQFGKRVLVQDGNDFLVTQLEYTNDLGPDDMSNWMRAAQSRGAFLTDLDKAKGIIHQGKRNAVNAVAPTENGQQTDLAQTLEQLQKDFDNAKRRIAELERRAPDAFAEINAIESKAPQKPRGGRRSGARESALDAQIDADVAAFLAGGDLRFADESQESLDKARFVTELVRKKSRLSDSTSKGTFINALVQSGGLTKDKAEQLYQYATAKQKERREAQKADEAEARAKKVAEQTVYDRLKEAAMKEATRTDRVNRKLNSLAEKFSKGKGTRKKKGATDDVTSAVEAAVAMGDKFDRETFIKQWVSDGADSDVVGKLATAIEVRIKANKELGRKSNQTPAEQLRGIVNRFKEPIERSKRAKDPIRKLATDTIKADSTVTEAIFLSQTKTLGIPVGDAKLLWQDLLALRQERADVRAAEKAARELEEGTPEQAEAQAIISKLAQSQSDTQDNRPNPPGEVSFVEQVYRDTIGAGPVRSRAVFVADLATVGVETETANRLYDLAIKERENRLEVDKAKAASRTIENMGPNTAPRMQSEPLPRLSDEILNHPMLTIAGPQERLAIMARIIQARSGLSAVDARIAAAKFDSQLVKVWDEVGLELAEKYVNKRNAPGFRKEPGQGAARPKPSLFDQIRKAIRAGAYDPNRRVLDEVAKQNGWTDLSAEENMELHRLDEKLNQPGLTDFEQGEIKRRMARIINGGSLPDETTKVIREFFLANVFSGLSTLGVQTSALWTQVVNVILRDSIGAAIGSATGSNRLNIQGYTAALLNLTNQFKNAVADASVALKTGQIRGVTEEEIINAQSKLERVYDRNVKILSDPKASTASKSVALGKILLSTSRFFLRNLSMMDNFVQGGIRTYLRDLELFSQAAGFGLSVSDLRKMTGAVMQMSNDFAADAEARGYGDVQVAGRSLPVPSPEKLAYVNDRIAMALGDALAGAGIPRTLIEASKERSYREAAMETGVNDFQTGQFRLLRAGMEGLRVVQQKGGVLGAVFVPVLRTVFNMMDRGAWYAPYGLWRLAGVAKKTGNFKTWRTPQGKLTSPYETALADPEQLIRRSMETALGTAIIVGASALLASQADEPEEERLFRINLGGPSPSERSAFTAWRKSGRRPYSIQFRTSKDSDWVTVGFRRGGMEVFNLAFTMLGAWDQKDYRNRKDESAMEGYAWTLAKELSGELMFPLRPLTSRQASVSADSVAGQIGYYVSGFVPGASLLKTPARFRDYQDHVGPAAAFAAQIPVVQMTLADKPRLNSLGDPIGARGDSSFDQWARFGIPFGVTPKQPELRSGQKPEDAHVYMLMRRKEYFPAVKTEADFEGAITHDEYREFVKKRGAAIKDYVKRNYSTLDKMDPDKFQEILSQRGRKLTEQVQRQMNVKLPK